MSAPIEIDKRHRRRAEMNGNGATSEESGSGDVDPRRVSSDLDVPVIDISDETDSSRRVPESVSPFPEDSNTSDTEGIKRIARKSSMRHARAPDDTSGESGGLEKAPSRRLQFASDDLLQMIHPIPSTPSEAPATPTMDNYEIKATVGKGSFGQVLVANHKGDNEPYAIKEISNFRSKPKNKQNLVISEVKVAASVSCHPNVIQYKEAMMNGENVYIVMEYAKGGDLKQKLLKELNPLGADSERKRWTEDYILKIFIQICLAVKHLHDCNILHRDLKLENVFLTHEGDVKLGDFGNARQMDGPHHLANTPTGTPVYMSPEIAQGVAYNMKTDIWSLGIMLYEMMSGQTPFLGPSLEKLIHQIIYERHPSLPSYYSLELRVLCDRMLEKSPGNRPSIDAILQQQCMQRAFRRLPTERRRTFRHDGSFKERSDVLMEKRREGLAHVREIRRELMYPSFGRRFAPPFANGLPPRNISLGPMPGPPGPPGPHFAPGRPLVSRSPQKGPSIAEKMAAAAAAAAADANGAPVGRRRLASMGEYSGAGGFSPVSVGSYTNLAQAAAAAATTTTYLTSVEDIDRTTSAYSSGAGGGSGAGSTETYVSNLSAQDTPTAVDGGACVGGPQTAPVTTFTTSAADLLGSSAGAYGMFSGGYSYASTGLYAPAYSSAATYAGYSAAGAGYPAAAGTATSYQTSTTTTSTSGAGSGGGVVSGAGGTTYQSASTAATTYPAASTATTTSYQASSTTYPSYSAAGGGGTTVSTTGATPSYATSYPAATTYPSSASAYQYGTSSLAYGSGTYTTSYPYTTSYASSTTTSYGSGGFYTAGTGGFDASKSYGGYSSGYYYS